MYLISDIIDDSLIDTYCRLRLHWIICVDGTRCNTLAREILWIIQRYLAGWKFLFNVISSPSIYIEFTVLIWSSYEWNLMWSAMFLVRANIIIVDGSIGRHLWRRRVEVGYCCCCIWKDQQVIWSMNMNIGLQKTAVYVRHFTTF